MTRPRDCDLAGRPRPLPSVDIALLPHERKAERNRKAAWTTVAALALAAGSAALSHPYLASSAGTPDLAASAGAPATGPTPGTYLAASPDHAPPTAIEPVLAAGVLGPSRVPLPTIPLKAAAAISPPWVAAGAPLALGASARFTQTGAKPPIATTTEMPPTTAQDSPAIRVFTFGGTSSFQDALVNTGLSAPEATALVQALTPHLDFRRCRPADELHLTYDERGGLRTFEYRASQSERYLARRQGDHFLAEKMTVALETRRIHLGGYVDESLGQTLERMGLGEGLVGAFVEAFEKQVNFQRDTRVGDRFRIIVEQRLIEGEPSGYGTVHALEYEGERVGKLRAYGYTEGGQPEFFDERGRARVGGWLRTPVRYDFISSPFNRRRRHPILKRVMPHHGIDYVAATGTPVRAAADGTITFAGRKGANGNLVSIRHADGYETHYAHLSRIQAGIRAGTRVRQHTVIGAVGSTGRSTGPHLHFGLKRHGRFLDPQSQLNGPGRALSKREMAKFKRTRKRLDRELDEIALRSAPSADARPVPAEAAFLPPAGPVSL